MHRITCILEAVRHEKKINKNEDVERNYGSKRYFILFYQFFAMSLFRFNYNQILFFDSYLRLLCTYLIRQLQSVACDPTPTTSVVFVHEWLDQV